MEDAESEVIREKVWKWYCGTIYNRLQPGVAIVLIGHRLHQDDLHGCLIEQMKAGGDYTIDGGSCCCRPSLRLLASLMSGLKTRSAARRAPRFGNGPIRGGGSGSTAKLAHRPALKNRLASKHPLTEICVLMTEISVALLNLSSSYCRETSLF